ncbi:hypothetical protein PM082_010012 [Marasmius tenuissimus]|nr:hypothetical protein PM082_010012 [Marasmius tenuissimus]
MRCVNVKAITSEGTNNATSKKLEVKIDQGFNTSGIIPFPIKPQDWSCYKLAAGMKGILKKEEHDWLTSLLFAPYPSTNLSSKTRVFFLDTDSSGAGKK